jgi:multiple sugar transport system substrate-binding protein
MDTKIVRLWTMPNAGFASESAISREIFAFRKLYPDVEILAEIVPWLKAWDRLMVAIKKQHGPDMIQIGNTWTTTCNFLGGLRSFTGMDMELEKRSFLPQVLSTCRHNDRLCAVPWFMDVQVVYWRKDIFRKVGLSESIFDTWESFRSACRKLRKAGYIPIGIAGLEDSCLIQYIAPWIWSAGGNFLDTTNGRTRASFADADALKGLDFWFSLLAEGAVDHADIELDRGTVSEHFFMRNKHAMHICGTWPLSDPSLSQGTQFSRHFDVSLLPQGPAGRFVFIGGSNLAITSFSDVTEEAILVLEHLLSSESLIRYTRAVGMVPPTTPEQRLWAIQVGETGEKVISFLRSGRSLPAHSLWGSMEMILVEHIAKILSYIRSDTYTRDRLQDEMNKASQKSNELLASVA